MAPALGGPWRREGSEQMRHGHGTETPAQTVQSKLNLNSGYVRIVEEGWLLSGGGEASKVRKEGRIPAGGRGRTAQAGKWPELLEKIVEEMKGEI